MKKELKQISAARKETGNFSPTQRMSLLRAFHPSPVNVQSSMYCHLTLSHLLSLYHSYLLSHSLFLLLWYTHSPSTLPVPNKLTKQIRTK